MSLDLSGDLLLADGTEAVTVTWYDLAGVATGTATVSALRGPILGDLTAAGEAVHLVDTTTWLLPASLLFPLRRGCRIVSLTSGTWEVLSDDVIQLGVRLEARCVRVSL